MKLVRANIQDAENLWRMQIAAFKDLYAKYQDAETSPFTEPLEKVIMRLSQPDTYYYYIQVEDTIVGAIRVVDTKAPGKYKIISPIFILPEFRCRGYAQRAIKIAEELHGYTMWKLNTILQEIRNCALYEKLGYVKTGEVHIINTKMTLVDYKK